MTLTLTISLRYKVPIILPVYTLSTGWNIEMQKVQAEDPQEQRGDPGIW